MTNFEIPIPLRTTDLTMADGAVIRIRQHGNADGPRLILAHGNGFAIDAYFPFWRCLMERFEIVLYDQRNHGHNPRHDVTHHDVPYFVKDMEAVFQGVQQAFGRKPTGGVFHSISAVTAIWHAQDVGWRWDALILFDPPLVPSPGHDLHEIAKNFELNLAKWSKNRPERFTSPAELGDQFKQSKSLSRWVPGAHDLMARAILREDPAAGDWFLCCPSAGESQVYLTNSTLDLCPRLGDLKGPVIFITSDPDDPNARAPGLVNRALHQEFGQPYQIVPQTTHMVQVERPAACAAIVTAFLDESSFAA